MLKKFFISMLGTMAGLWISIAILIFGGIIALGVALGSGASETTVKLKKNSILYLDLSGVIDERYQPTDFLQFIQASQSKAPSLEEMLNSVHLAAKDKNIEGIYIHCAASSMGIASREELIEALEKFKKAGKWIYAYADGYTQGDYLVATTADNLVLNPMGNLDIHGVGGTTPFFKGLLDKLGIKMQIIKVGTYKSAVEPFILTQMSEPARRQMQQYCDTLWSYTAQTIAENRNIPLDSVRSMASQLISTRPAENYIQSGLVDSLFYERMVNENLAVMSGLDADKDPRLISPSDYLSAKGENVSGRHIAVLYAFGDIVDEGNGGIVGTKMVEEIIDLAKDDDVAGMVLRVNSPGGSAFASEQIWDALQFFKKQGKPLYVSMGDYAASGGYYISCGADRIFADRTTITGSIGVFGMIPDASGLVTDKLGVTFSTVETNPNAAPISAMEAMTPVQYEAMQQHVELIYDLFTGRVAAGRGMSVEDVKKIAEGRVWVGSNALELGLVDSLGSLETTVAALADELDMSASDVISYPRYEEKLWEKILRENNAFDELKTAGYDMETLRYVQLVNKLRNAATVQARMEEITIQ